MKRKQSKFRIAIIRLQDRLGPFAEACTVGVVGLLFLLIAVCFGIGSLSDWASFFAAFIVSAIIIFFMRKAARQHAILMEVTMSYLIHGGKSLLDHLLGKLIGGTWRKEQLKPGDALFDVLEEICKGQDWELKRRIAEALPALGEVNIKRTMKIISILREDWEPKRWKSDLRRRAVEALTIHAVPKRIILLHRAKADEITPLLQLRESDEVFTIMAVAEALHEWEKDQPDIVVQLRQNLVDFSRKTLSQDKIQAIDELLNHLKISRTIDILALAEKLEQMGTSSNVFLRIAASRNVLRIAERLPGKTLDLMLNFVASGQEKNVRRPISKEQSIKFLIRMIVNRTHRSKAESILFKLLADSDAIIRVTTFDMTESIKEQDSSLLLRVCNFILENEPSANESSEILIERAQRVKENL